MRVIERSAQTFWSKQARCTGEPFGGGGCNSLLEVEISDIWTGEKNGSWAESGDRCFCFTCPLCGITTEIKKVPDQQMKWVHRSKTEWKKANDRPLFNENPGLTFAEMREIRESILGGSVTDTLLAAKHKMDKVLVRATELGLV